MDIITQGIIGGSIYTSIHRKHSIKNFLIGAVITNLPDLDIYADLFIQNPIDQFFAHRGITHSIVGFTTISIIVAICIYVYHYWRFGHKINLWKYIGSIWISILGGHLILDWMTGYGIRRLLPRDRSVTSMDNIFVIDLPLLVVLLGLAIGYMCVSRYRQLILHIIIGFAYIYFGITIGLQYIASQVLLSDFAQQYPEIQIVDYIVAPEPLQTILRRGIIKTSDGSIYEGWHSILDAQTQADRVVNTGTQIPSQITNALSLDEKDRLENIYIMTRGVGIVHTSGSDYIIQNLGFGYINGRLNTNRKNVRNFSFLLKKHDNRHKLELIPMQNSLSSGSRDIFIDRIYGI